MLKTLDRDAADRHRRDLPVPRLVPLGAHPGRRDPDLARRRRVPDAGAPGFTINLLTLLAIVLSVGLVVDDAIVMVENVERHLHVGKKPFEAALARGARAGRADHRDDDHARRRLRADRRSRAASPARSSASSRSRSPGAVIVSGVVALTLSPMMGSRLLRPGDTERGFAGLGQPPVRGRPRARTRARSPGRSPTGRSSSSCGRSWSLLIVPFYLFSQKELAPKEDQGVVFGIVQAAANATLDQTKLFAAQVYDVYTLVPGDGEHLPDHVADRRLRRHGHEAVERAEEDDRSSS